MMWNSLLRLPPLNGPYSLVVRLRQRGSSRASRVVEVSSACVVCGAGLIGRERVFCRECRAEMNVFREAYLACAPRLGLPR